ncbi:hypothetical protein VB711_23195 [Cronbergia sp. UHCC 0137]|uniref:hypothetical protein n=1 Tax=Cronbergia sp. UHCC 0137 TaxID=3110239 RepID=UPI002B20A21F|nr:hypothetical protein [Cronbergia sp. UHCC 0137]MEA5620723.1 hypothetical protein [Cronbergia sp. UHCC 0137]
MTFDFREAMLEGVGEKWMNHSQDEADKLTKLSLKVASNRSTSKNLLVKHPWIFLFGLLATSVGISISSYYSMIYVGDLPKSEIMPSVVIDNSTPTLPDNSNPTPLWLLIAIAGSCGSGCLMIFVLLTRSPRRHKLTQNHRH